MVQLYDWSLYETHRRFFRCHRWAWPARWLCKPPNAPHIPIESPLLCGTSARRRAPRSSRMGRTGGACPWCHRRLPPWVPLPFSAGRNDRDRSRDCECAHCAPHPGAAVRVGAPKSRAIVPAPYTTSESPHARASRSRHEGVSGLPRSSCSPAIVPRYAFSLRRGTALGCRTDAAGTLEFLHRPQPRAPPARRRRRRPN